MTTGRRLNAPGNTIRFIVEVRSCIHRVRQLGSVKSFIAFAVNHVSRHHIAAERLSVCPSVRQFTSVYTNNSRRVEQIVMKCDIGNSFEKLWSHSSFALNWAKMPGNLHENAYAFLRAVWMGEESVAGKIEDRRSGTSFGHSQWLNSSESARTVALRTLFVTSFLIYLKHPNSLRTLKCFIRLWQMTHRVMRSSDQ